MNLQEIPLKEISPSPRNPRKSFSGPKFEELAASIAQKGVIEPIIVRPVKGKARYEIVAGERRYNAAGLAKLEKIPALVRELSDDEAYDFMIIENLQREDLTEREAAESFKVYIGRHGDDGILELAEKTGITAGYIRSRIRVLGLPAKVLKAWDEGKLVFGHLQQLLRLQDKAALEEAMKTVFERLSWREGMTVAELRSHIDEESPALSAARFKVKETCAKCESNSAIQRDLFGLESKAVRCLNPVCFRKHQEEWFAANWKTTAEAKKYGTNGVRVVESGCVSGVKEFYEWSPEPGAKCRECADFVSSIEISGRVREGKCCAGDRSCFEAITHPRSAKEKASGERDPEAPRAAWHGEYFRDVFLSKRIPEVLAAIDPDDPKIKELLLACAIHGERNVLSIREDFSGGILNRSSEDKKKVYKTVIEKIVLSGQHVGPSSWNGFGTKGRRIVAEYLGIDLAKEFAVDAEYLEKKTKAEILAFGKKHGIFKEKKVLEYLAAKLKRNTFESCKKSELVEVILKAGVDLVGKVPDEILKG